MENGLSNHDAQILVMNRLQLPFQKITQRNKTRLINIDTVVKFQLLVSKESWASVYNTDDINKFCGCTFLNIIENSSVIIYRSYRKNNDDFITKGIRISCKCKRRSRNTDDLQVKHYLLQ
jgi:hypothetical protein